MALDHRQLRGRSTSEATPRRRRLRSLGPSDRRALERAGWRTLLDYREDHVRAADGTLLAAVPCWTAEAEHASGAVLAASVVAASPDAAWARLRAVALAPAAA